MTRIEHKAWRCVDGLTPGSRSPMQGQWVPYQTYRWATHGGWTIPTKPWIIIEIQP